MYATGWKGVDTIETCVWGKHMLIFSKSTSLVYSNKKMFFSNQFSLQNKVDNNYNNCYYCNWDSGEEKPTIPTSEQASYVASKIWMLESYFNRIEEPGRQTRKTELVISYKNIQSQNNVYSVWSMLMMKSSVFWNNKVFFSSMFWMP